MTAAVIEQGVNGLVVPPYLEDEEWPSLGGQVCDFIETYLVHGPGDLRGEPAVIDDETRALIYRIYEVYPRKHPKAGRRRFRRVAISLRKGTAKTEKAAWIAAAELHPAGPVRCDGWDAKGEPVGVGVTDPYIPMVAYTEEQTEELAYGALYVICGEGPLADDFDIGLDRIMRIDGDGKAAALANAPGARDGARTTFQHADETHRFVLKRLKDSHRTMLANLPKRKAADPWSLETTTAPTPGEGSIAEETWEYAELIAQGKRKNPSLFFFHRQASAAHDLTTRKGIRAAVVEASGPAAEWSNIDAIVDQWDDPTTDKAFLERVWLNRRVQSSRQVFDIELVRAARSPREQKWPARKTPIAIGFDGSRTNDATGIVGTEIESGYQFVIGCWERPETADDEWEVPGDEVDQSMADAFERWKVVMAFCDPPYWESYVDQWAGRWPKKVVRFYTSRLPKMAAEVAAYVTAWQAGEVSYDGDKRLLAHLGNARKRELNMLNDQGERLYVMEKERKDSPLKIDLAMAANLSWAARGKGVSDGALKKKTGGMRALY
ncbi:MAG: hypothetical protein WAU42_14730 [Solirubrobacteraceae bacterium]